MLFIEVLIKMLLITAACQSLTIYQSNQTKPNIDDYLKFKFVNSATNSKPPVYSNIYPVQYQYNNRWTTTNPKTTSNVNKEPVTGVSLESKVLNEPKKVTEKIKQPSSVNYNNKIYHINTIKRANRLADDEQGVEYPKYIIRKQRNLNEIHDDKLIEQNDEELKDINDDDDRQFTTSTTTATASLSSSIKQPSIKSSHETRYLHDIFLNYPKSHHVNFGHIELSPALFEKRFETQKAGNRYKGEIMWLDNMGGFAQHYWDLAQGKV